MIDFDKLDVKRDVGRWVIYKGAAGETEIGRIKGWTHQRKTIFVVYKCAGEWHRYYEFTGQATKPADLHWMPHEMCPLLRRQKFDTVYDAVVDYVREYGVTNDMATMYEYVKQRIYAGMMVKKSMIDVKAS